MCRAVLVAACVGLCVASGGAGAARLLVDPPDGAFIKVKPGGIGAMVGIRLKVVLEDGAAAFTDKLTVASENVFWGTVLIDDMQKTGRNTYAYELTLHEIKFGTQAVRFTVTNASADAASGANSNPVATKNHHFEIVPNSLTEEQYLPGAHGAESAAGGSVGSQFSMHLSQLTVPTDRSPRTINIIFAGALEMDGQKTIWLNQIARLPRNRFNMTFACFACHDKEASDQIEAQHGLAYRLQQLGVPLITRSGLEMSKREAEKPGFVENALQFLRRWHRYGSYDLLSISEDQRSFIHNFNACFVDVFRGFDILVMGNSGGIHTKDGILVEGARIAGVKRIVLELTTANTGLLKSDEVDVLISPSEFALSKLWYGRPSSGRSSSDPPQRTRIVAVIPPGIDMPSALESPPTPAPKPPMLTPTTPPGVGTNTVAVSTTYATRRLRVGYVGRLAPEKSPGLFLKAAKGIAQRLGRRHRRLGYSELQHIEFVVIGDGGIRKTVERIGHILLPPGGGDGGDDDDHQYSGRVNASLRFLGWVSRTDLLVKVLPTLDMVINPSLTPETFCISNIEAMAAGVPIVSFGVGGQGSYLNAHTNGSAGFVVGTDGQDCDLDPTQWPGLLADLAVSVLTMPEDDRAALVQSSRRHAKKYDIVDIIAQSAEMYKRVLFAPNSGRWRRRATVVSATRDMFRLMQPHSELYFMSFVGNDEGGSADDVDLVYVADASGEEKNATVNDSVWRGARLARVNSAATRWFRILVEPSEMIHFALINHSSWRNEFGACPKIGNVLQTVSQHFRFLSKDGLAARPKSQATASPRRFCGAHCRKIASMHGHERQLRSVVAVAPSLDALETPGAVTIIDGGRRAARFVLNEEIALGKDTQLVELFLGVDPMFTAGSEGGFFC